MLNGDYSFCFCALRVCFLSSSACHLVVYVSEGREKRIRCIVGSFMGVPPEGGYQVQPGVRDSDEGGGFLLRMPIDLVGV